MRQRCKGIVNTDSVKVIKVNEQLAQCYLKNERIAEESLTGTFFQQRIDGSAFSESKGSSGHGGSTCQVEGFFLLFLGKQNAGMQESSCISAPCNAERVMGCSIHTHSTEIWRWGVNTYQQPRQIRTI